MGGEFIINAYSSHTGGGRTELADLLHDIPSTVQVLVFVDRRMILPEVLPAGVLIEKVTPSFVGRLWAEWRILQESRNYRWMLRLGSLPPLFRLPIPSFVYFENRHLLRGESLAGMPWARKLRVTFERLWIRTFHRHATCFVVQTMSVAQDLQRSVGPHAEIQIAPFREHLHAVKGPAPEFDYIYVSSGDAHKNHKNLIEAWCWLAEREVRPSLALTLNPDSHPELTEYLEQRTETYGLKIHNLGRLNPEQVAKRYLSARAAIYPSTCESLGLPIVEAMQLGLPILASELDYVRDLVDPAQTFDPHSPKSIARAVLRHMKHVDEKTKILTPQDFITTLRRAI